MQACSDLAHVLVGVRRVTVVHIGHEGELVVIHFLRSHFVGDFLYQEMFSLQYSEQITEDVLGVTTTCCTRSHCVEL